ncbi:MAG: TolC family protein [Nitrospira sp.]|nr:TolC family protein [Nitrospira sp.]
MKVAQSVWRTRRGLGAAMIVLHMVFASLAGAEPVGQDSQPPLPPLVLTLRGAMSAVADNNPDVLLYRERIAAARGQVLTQLGAMLPNISSTVRQTRQTQFLGTIGLTPVRTDPFSIFDVRVSASQNLVSLSLIQKWRASRETLHAVEYEADARANDTMASVGLLYMEGLKAADMVKAHEANQQVMSELLEIVRQRQKGGVATGLDAARLEAQLAHEKQRAIAARYDLQQTTLNVLNLLSLPYETPVVLADTFQAEPLTVPASPAVVEEALAKRPEVQAQNTKVKASELAYSSITGERVPSIVAQGDYGLIGNRWNNTLGTYNMALLLQIPIFDGAQREGRIAEAGSQLRQEALRMRSVTNQVKLEVHDALAAMAVANEQVSIAQAGLQAATKELSLARERYAVITTTSHFELTNALTAVARARENLVQALFELNAARVNMARATGTLAAVN